LKPTSILFAATIVQVAFSCVENKVGDSQDKRRETNTNTDTAEPTDSTADIDSGTQVSPDTETEAAVETESNTDLDTDTGASVLCGNGVLDDGEECDDGVLSGEYGWCAPGCVLGPHCGDNIVQPQYEDCDVGGDPTVECCTLACKILAIIGCDYIQCGDGVVQTGEACDDGVLAGEYGGCAPGCVPGPRCGDGIVQFEHEGCDDGIDNGLTGCTLQCTLWDFQ
jgi:hypothetical protein